MRNKLLILLGLVCLLGTIFSYKTPSNEDSRTSSGAMLFTPVGVQHISDGTIGGLDIRYFVDKNTGVLYALTEKYRWGYGLSFTVVVDTDGKPVIYEEGMFS